MPGELNRWLMKALVATSSTVFALNSHAAAPKACFWAESWPECRSHWITEAGLVYRFNDELEGWRNTYSYGGDVDDRFSDHLLYTIELGYMRNKTARHSYGGGLEVVYDDKQAEVRVAVRPRFKWWFGHDFSLDVSPGLYVWTESSGAPGYSLSATWFWRNELGVTARADYVRPSENPDWKTSFYGGVRFGSETGLALSIAGPLIAWLVVATQLVEDPPGL